MSPCAWSCLCSCWLKIALPQIEACVVALGGLRPPQFAHREGDGVEVLRRLAVHMGVAVGKDMPAVMDLHDPDLAAGIARQTGVAGRIDVACAHPLAHREFRPILERAREDALRLLALPDLV